MTNNEYQSVIDAQRLPDGLSWTIPILLSVDESFSNGTVIGKTLHLTDSRQKKIGLIEVSDIFKIDKEDYSLKVFGTLDQHHPGVQNILIKSAFCVGGDIKMLKSSQSDPLYYHSPKVMRDKISRESLHPLVGFSTRNIPHIGHEYQHNKALSVGNYLGVNVITGAEVRGSFNPEVVFEAYKIMIDTAYPASKVVLNNMQLPPIFAGPNEAFLQAIVLQNLGFTHFIVGRDHAGVGDYYGKYESQEKFNEICDLDIEILKLAEPRYCSTCNTVTESDVCSKSGEATVSINGRDIRRCLVEKRFDDLKSILNPVMQNYLIEISQDRVKFEDDVSAFSASKHAMFV